MSKDKPPGGLYMEGRFNGGFFALRVWGAYVWSGLFSEFYSILAGNVLPLEFYKMPDQGSSSSYLYTKPNNKFHVSS